MRAVLVVALIGCGGAAPGAPAPAAAPAPAPAPPTTAMAEPMPMSSDPQEGGEVTPAAAAAPIGNHDGGEPMQPGEPEVSGDLDKSLVKRVIRGRIQQIRLCYEAQLLKNPKLEGKLVVKFTIAPTGSVPQAKATGMDGSVEPCVEAEFKQLEFPKGPGVVTVSYPIVFKTST